MKARDLFTIILKVFGIYIIKDILIAIPPVLKNFYQFVNVDPDVALFSLIFSLFVLAFYLGIVYFMLSRTGYIISKLNLTSGLNDQTLTINLHRSQVYSIAIIITGIVVLVFSIPDLIRNLYAWYDYIGLREKAFGVRPYDYSNVFVSLAEVIIGLLFLGNQKTLVNFIEYRRRRIKVDESE